MEFTLFPEHLSLINNDLKRVIDPGVFEAAAGGKQPEFSGYADAATTGVVTGSFEVLGKITELNNGLNNGL